MIEQFAPEDNHNDDSDIHKQARILSQEPVDMEDDKDFTAEEIRNAVASMGHKKVPREDGITGEIYKCTFEFLPNYITALYNGSLRRNIPQKMEASQIDTNYQTWERKQRRCF